MIYHQHKQEYESGWQSNFDDLAETVRDTVEDLKPRRKQFTSIVVTGVSGLVVGAPVALRLRKPLVVVRKRDDDSHSSSLVEGWQRLGKRPLFLDDFVSGGDTRYYVETKVQQYANVKLAHEYQYKYRRFNGVALGA